MTQLRATAPGKLILAGEYAVLQGGPAIAMAVGRRAEALLTLDAKQCELLIVSNSDAKNSSTSTRYGFELTGSDVHWHQDPGEQGGLLEAAVAVLGESGTELSTLAPFSLQLCTQDFYANDAAANTKLGLGSSAALAVALSGCLQQAAGGEVDVRTALAVHRKFQRGEGSGVDVHASYRGGMIAMCAGSVSSLVWPAPMQILPVWTGEAASTPAMLQRLNEFAAANPGQHAELMGALSAQSAEVLRACEAMDMDDLTAALRAFAEELHGFDAVTGLGIWSAEHVRLAQIAESAGLIYKPSGAGGGDFGLAFGTDPDALTGFRQRAEHQGFGCAQLELGVKGLEIA